MHNIMAKKKEPTRRTKIFSKEFTGYLDEMPEEAKDKMKAEKPKLHKQIFEKK